MEKIIAFISGYLGVNSVLDVILMVIDIAIVAFLFYEIGKILQNTRAFAIIRALIIFVVALFVARILHLYVVEEILNVIINMLPVVLVVLFAPEIRKLMENFGKKKLSDIVKSFSGRNNSDEDEEKEIKRIIDETVDAASNMALTKTGAIIVFEVKDNITEWDKQGTIIDAVVSSRLLRQIFVVNTPLHDAAVIIRKKRIYAAQCVLPLTDRTDLGRELGTRHRAAIGATEKADCVAVVVSEETGIISYAKGGDIQRKVSPDYLRTLLQAELLPETSYIRPGRNSSKRKKKGGAK